MEKRKFIEVGFTALREPGTGNFLPAVPLYIQADDNAKEAAQQLKDDIGGLLMQRIKAYKRGCQEAGVAV